MTASDNVENYYTQYIKRSNKSCWPVQKTILRFSHLFKFCEVVQAKNFSSLSTEKTMCVYACVIKYSLKVCYIYRIKVLNIQDCVCVCVNIRSVDINEPRLVLLFRANAFSHAYYLKLFYSFNILFIYFVYLFFSFIINFVI